MKSKFTPSELRSFVDEDLTEASLFTGLGKNIATAGFTGAAKMPLDVAKGFVSFMTGTTFNKKFWDSSGDLFKTWGKIFLGAYAYIRAPKYVKEFMRKMVKFLPNVKARLINIWTLIYPDLEDEKQYNIIMYSPTGQVLARRTITEKEAEEYIEQYMTNPETGEQYPHGRSIFGQVKRANKAYAKQMQPAEPKTKMTKAAKKAERAMDKLKNINVENVNLNDFLDFTEEEVISEALGLPPIKAVYDKIRFSEGLLKPCPVCHGTGEVNGHTCPKCHGTGVVYTAKIAPTLLRFRLWIVEVYDDTRNKTYMFVFDSVSPPDKQPVDKWSYEGKQDIL